MRPEIQEYLDGERTLASLADELREEALAWSRALEELDDPAMPLAPPELEARVMAVIEGRAAPREGALAWMLRRRAVHISPALGLAAAAALAALLLLRPAQQTAVPTVGREVFVQFVLEAPGATSVAVAGDFNEWEGGHLLEDADGDGVWTGRVSLRPGVHQYMFVIDGGEWVTDPNADRYSDDGFGNRNAVIAVAASEA